MSSSIWDFWRVKIWVKWSKEDFLWMLVLVKLEESLRNLVLRPVVLEGRFEKFVVSQADVVTWRASVDGRVTEQTGILLGPLCPGF